MAFSFIDATNLGEKYTLAKDYTEKLTKPFAEFERIANNLPSKDRDSRYSDVTDGTTAAVIRKKGKRIVQQLPTGVVETDDENDWLPIVAEFILLHKIIPYANLDFDLLQKCWQTIEAGGIFGGTATYVPFVNHDGYFCTDLALPYWADVFIPAGYKSANSTPYRFLRSWWQTTDIDAIIDQEKKLQKQAKARGDAYESTWDLAALESIREASTQKHSTEQNPTEKQRSTNPKGIEVVTAFQEGVGATFYTFCPAQSADDNDVTVVRRKKNKDPRGKMPLFWYFQDADGNNPLGRGDVELIGPLQNLIDSDMQMYQWNRALMLAPPLIVRGETSTKKFVYAPNAIMKMTDPNGSISALDVDTSAVVNYPELYGLQKSQLLNLVASPDTSISATVGNPGFGKTPKALGIQQATMSADDNYTRKNFEAWFELWCETAINVFFAERTGKEVLQLDDDTAARLRKLADTGQFDPTLLSENNQIVIDYDSATPALKFRVDASTSKMKDDMNQLESLQAVLEALDRSSVLQQVIVQQYPEKVMAVYNRLVGVSSVEDPEELEINIADFKQQQEQAQAQQSAPAQPQASLPAGPAADAQIEAQLRSMGVPEDYIAQALDMLNKGYTADEVLTAIQGVMGHARG